MARVIFLLNSLGKSYLSFNSGEDFKKINQSETKLPVAAMFGNGS
jgi:hypothetical protein